METVASIFLGLLMFGSLSYIMWFKTRNFYIYDRDSDQDQIYTHFKINLRTRKQIKISRDEYWNKVDDNWQAKVKYSKWQEGW